MKQPFIYTLDTSSSQAVLAVLASPDAASAAPSAPLLELEAPCFNSASTALPELCRQAASAGFDLRCAAGIICGTGPGSFTGLRVAIAFTRGASIALRCPARGVNSGLALAHALPADATAFATVHDGRRGEIVLNPFIRRHGRWEAQALQIHPIATFHPDEALGPLLSSLNDAFFAKALPAFLERLRTEVPMRASALALDTSPWPDSEAALDLSLAPSYARPAVFVEPRSHRQV